MIRVNLHSKMVKVNSNLWKLKLIGDLIFSRVWFFSTVYILRWKRFALQANHNWWSIWKFPWAPYKLCDKLHVEIRKQGEQFREISCTGIHNAMIKSKQNSLQKSGSGTELHKCNQRGSPSVHTTMLLILKSTEALRLFLCNCKTLADCTPALP